MATLPPQSAAPRSRYVLVTTIDQLTFLTVSPGIDLTPYLNKYVLATGLFDASKNTLQISKDTDIQYLP